MIDEAFLERLSNWRRVYGTDRFIADHRHSTSASTCAPMLIENQKLRKKNIGGKLRN